jgi:hypothetical protein
LFPISPSTNRCLSAMPWSNSIVPLRSMLDWWGKGSGCGFDDPVTTGNMKSRSPDW